jgi:hypothetical protein
MHLQRIVCALQGGIVHDRKIAACQGSLRLAFDWQRNMMVARRTLMAWAYHSKRAAIGLPGHNVSRCSHNAADRAVGARHHAQYAEDHDSPVAHTACHWQEALRVDGEARQQSCMHISAVYPHSTAEHAAHGAPCGMLPCATACGTVPASRFDTSVR